MLTPAPALSFSAQEERQWTYFARLYPRATLVVDLPGLARVEARRDAALRRLPERTLTDEYAF